MLAVKTTVRPPRPHPSRLWGRPRVPRGGLSGAGRRLFLQGVCDFLAQSVERSIACSFFSLNHTAVRSLLLSPRDGLLGARTHAAQWPRAVLRSVLPGQPGAASSRGRPQRCPSFHSSRLVVAAVLNRQFAALLVKLGRLFLCLACDRLLSLSTVTVHAGSLGWGCPGPCGASSRILGPTRSTPGVLSPPLAVTAADVPRRPPATGDRAPSG